MDKQNNKMVIGFKTNNSLEFCLESFDTFYKENDITRHQTEAETSQQNNLTKIFNRTILECIRCMLLSIRVT